MPESFALLGEFRLLRPLWLLALLALPLVWYLFNRLKSNESSWSKAIDPDLLPYLLEGQSETRAKHGAIWVLAGVFLAIIALAGPAWQKVPQPVHRVENALILILDLSLSMQVEDVKPSRLVKARHKLLDILDQHQDGQAALIAYAGDAHVVSPLTDDTATIKNLIPALSPLIMPEMGSDPVDAINLGLQLLRDGGISRGKILLLSDGLEFSQIEPIVEQLSTSSHELAVLAVGTQEGGPIPLPEKGFLKQRGEIVIARAGIKSLDTLAKLNRGRFSHLQLDDSDIEYLLRPATLEVHTNTREIERDFDQWREEGPWLLLLLAPLAAFGFRRGLIFSVALLVVLPSQDALALTWHDLWLTADQQAAQAFENGDNQQAAEKFRSQDWKAAAHFRGEDFSSAAELYKNDSSATGQYNYGNALAKAGKLDEAIAAYDSVLQRNPDHEDAAFNKALLEQLKQQQQQQQQQQQDSQNNQQNQDNNQQQEQQSEQNQQSEQEQQNSQQQDPANQQQSNSQNEQAQNQQQQDSEQNPDQQQDDKQQQTENSNQSEQNQQSDAAQQRQQNAQKQQDAEQQSQEQQASAQPLSESDLSEEELQAMDQWLRRIPDDPGGLLRRKFDYEYRQRQLDQQFMPRSEGDPIW